MAELNISHKELSNPDTDLGLQAFSDWRVFTVSDEYEGRNSARVYGPGDFDVHQCEDGPTFIVVGAQVADERLRRHEPSLYARYGVTLGQLERARGGALVSIRTQKPSTWGALIARQ